MLQMSVGASYKNEDLKQITCDGTQQIFPTPTTAISKKPEKIFVQALAANTGTIMIGKTGVAADGSAGGYQLSAGANMTLPSHEWAHYYAIASASGQKLQVTYLSVVI